MLILTEHYRCSPNNIHFTSFFMSPNSVTKQKGQKVQQKVENSETKKVNEKRPAQEGSRRLNRSRRLIQALEQPISICISKDSSEKLLLLLWRRSDSEVCKFASGTAAGTAFMKPSFATTQSTLRPQILISQLLILSGI